jgi:hypothetical protein
MNGISPTGAYGAPALLPQGFFGTLLGAPVGGLIGRGIGGLFGQPALGSQIGQIAGGIGGSFLPFAAEPMQAYAQQMAQQQAYQQQLQQLAQQQALAQQLQQLAQQQALAQQLQQLAQQQQLQQLTQQTFAPQGWFGNLISQIGQPVGAAIGGLYGQPVLGGQIGSIAAQIGRLLPFQLDPVQQAWAQQMAQQMAQQQWAQQLAQQQPYGASAQPTYATGQTLH